MIVYFKPNPTPNLMFGWSLGSAEPNLRLVTTFQVNYGKNLHKNTAQLETEAEKNHNKGSLQKLRHAIKVFLLINLWIAIGQALKDSF